MTENKYIGGWVLSNYGGVQVLEIKDDYMIVKYYDEEPETVEIQFDEEGESFIKVGELELYLSECLRYQQRSY